MGALSAAAALALSHLAGCAARALPQVPMVPKGNLHALGVGASADPTVGVGRGGTGAHLFPEVVDEERSFGTEPGGGVRSVVAGLRVVTLSSGAVLSAPDRLPATPQQTFQMPERLGGGFVFQIGTTLWRSDRWLAAARPFFTSPSTIQKLIVGLDRLYVKTPQGAYHAFDARTGARLDMGPWPASPVVGAYASSDGWRAVAIADLRGVVATFDAGGTWRPLGLPIIAKDVVQAGDALAVRGVDLQGQEQWYEVRADGQVGRLAGSPTQAASEKGPAHAQDPGGRAFGKRPLAAVIEDGWPLTDGSAIVARDGALARVRLSDGALLEAVTDAYPLKPSRCHPLSLARPKDLGAFGFVCGESRGRSIVYRYDPSAGRMVELRRFDKPRAVLSSGNGALAVRGKCAADASPDDGDRTPTQAQQSYCLYGKDDQWREIRVRGDVGGERLVVLGDGRIVVVSPPHGDLTTTRLTLLDKGKASTIAIAFPPISADVARALKHGVWMDGFEERRPGVIGGWIDGGGTVLGIEIALDGHAKLGKHIRDASAPMVSGRYGLGWTASRRGFETIDGGMTWTELELPEPIANPRLVASRACGPVGCSAGGWLRVGWGPSASAPKVDVPPIPRGASWHPPVALDLDCEPMAGAPPEPAKPADKKAAGGLAGIHPAAPPPRGYGGYGFGYGANVMGMAELPPFFSLAAPVLRADDLGLVVEVNDTADRTPRTGLLARLYTWGPKATEWEHTGKWLARWTWPYGGWNDIRSSQATVAPFPNLEAARRGLGIGPVQPIQWSMGVGDDASHALLVGRRVGGAGGVTETLVYALEADRPPLEVRRLDGELLGEVDATLRAAGHWYVVTGAQPHELPSTVLWLVDGSFAREIARVPRAGFEGKASARLARRSDSRAVGLVIEGQPGADRPVSQRWVLPIDLDAGSIGEPELLGSVDLADHAFTLCGDASAGASSAASWVLDAALGGSVTLKLPKTTLRLNQPLVRVRLTRDTACIEHLAGSLEYYGSTSPDALVRAKGDAAPAPRADAIGVGIYSSQRMRHPLRCATKR